MDLPRSVFLEEAHLGFSPGLSYFGLSSYPSIKDLLKNILLFSLTSVSIHAECRNVRKQIHMNNNNKNKTLNSSVRIPMDSPILCHS